MQKYYKTSIAFLFVLSIVITAQEKGKDVVKTCSTKQIIKACRPSMKPFVYDSYAIYEIEFGKTTQSMEEEFTAFAGQKYRLSFCNSGFAENIKIEVYDKNKKIATRKLVAQTSTSANTPWTFEPPKSGTYYLEYKIPASIDGTEKNGCMVMLIGYEDN